MEEAYVSFETAKLLKEKGFDVPLMQVYSSYGEPKTAIGYNWNGISDSNYFLRPTQQMAMRWLREVHLLFICINYINGDEKENENGEYCYTIQSLPDSSKVQFSDLDGEFTTYEEACEAAIKYSLENLI